MQILCRCRSATHQQNIFNINASYTDTAADKALNAVIVAKVDHAVQHEAESVGFTIRCSVTEKVRSHSWDPGIAAANAFVESIAAAL